MNVLELLYNGKNCPASGALSTACSKAVETRAGTFFTNDSLYNSDNVYFLMQALTAREDVKQLFLSKEYTKKKYQAIRQAFKDSMRTIKKKYTNENSKTQLTETPLSTARITPQRLKRATDVYLTQGLDEAHEKYKKCLKDAGITAPADGNDA